MSKLRRAEDLQLDTQTHLMTGRLIGASEMMARYVQVHGDEQAQQMGQRLDAILQFFFEGHVSTAIERRE
jgi:hypothetical protein